MNKLARICNKNIFLILWLCVFLVMCFCYQEIAANAFWSGLKTCYYKVIPSLFPILVVTSIIFTNPLAQYLGIVFMPFVSILGIKNKTAGTAIFFGIIGGFAVFCNSIDNLIKNKSITKNQAELLLCTGIGTGPSFIICAVGGTMLKNITIGVYLFVSVTIASLICTVIMRVLFFKGTSLSVPVATTLKEQPFTLAFVSATKTAVTSCINMCGFILFFNILYAIISKHLTSHLKLICAVFLEVTLACKNAIIEKNEYSIFFIITALSFVGFSILMQSKSLLPPDISLKYFFISRFFHLPISLLIYFLLCRLFPISLNVAISVIKPLRFSPSVSIIIIFMVLVMLAEATPGKSVL